MQLGMSMLAPRSSGFHRRPLAVRLLQPFHSSRSAGWGCGLYKTAANPRQRPAVRVRAMAAEVEAAPKRRGRKPKAPPPEESQDGAVAEAAADPAAKPARKRKIAIVKKGKAAASAPEVIDLPPEPPSAVDSPEAAAPVSEEASAQLVGERSTPTTAEQESREAGASSDGAMPHFSESPAEVSAPFAAQEGSSGIPALSEATGAADPDVESSNERVAESASTAAEDSDRDKKDYLSEDVLPALFKRKGVRGQHKPKRVAAQVDFDQQQLELAEYMALRDSRRGEGTEQRRKMRGLGGTKYTDTKSSIPEEDEETKLVLRRDDKGELVDYDYGGLGRGKMVWWKVRTPTMTKVKARAVVKELQNALLLILPREVIDSVTGEVVQSPRVIEIYTPSKVVDHWNAKTQKMGRKTIFHDEGTVLFRAILDKHLYERVQRSFHIENFVRRIPVQGALDTVPVPLDDEEVEAMREWEQKEEVFTREMVDPNWHLPAQSKSDRVTDSETWNEEVELIKAEDSDQLVDRLRHAQDPEKVLLRTKSDAYTGGYYNPSNWHDPEREEQDTTAIDKVAKKFGKRTGRSEELSTDARRWEQEYGTGETTPQSAEFEPASTSSDWKPQQERQETSSAGSRDSFGAEKRQGSQGKVGNAALWGANEAAGKPSRAEWPSADPSNDDWPSVDPPSDDWPGADSPRDDWGGAAGGRGAARSAERGWGADVDDYPFSSGNERSGRRPPNRAEPELDEWADYDALLGDAPAGRTLTRKSFNPVKDVLRNTSRVSGGDSRNTRDSFRDTPREPRTPFSREGGRGENSSRGRPGAISPRVDGPAFGRLEKNAPTGRGRPPWTCPLCNHENEGRASNCASCDASVQELRWKCKDCGFANFANRFSCFKCNARRNGAPIVEQANRDNGSSQWRPFDSSSDAFEPRPASRSRTPNPRDRRSDSWERQGAEPWRPTPTWLDLPEPRRQERSFRDPEQDPQRRPTRSWDPKLESPQRSDRSWDPELESRPPSRRDGANRGGDRWQVGEPGGWIAPSEGSRSGAKPYGWSDANDDPAEAWMQPNGWFSADDFAGDPGELFGGKQKGRGREETSGGDQRREPRPASNPSDKWFDGGDTDSLWDPLADDRQQAATPLTTSPRQQEPQPQGQDGGQVGSPAKGGSVDWGKFARELREGTGDDFADADDDWQWGGAAAPAADRGLREDFSTDTILGPNIWDDNAAGEDDRAGSFSEAAPAAEVAPKPKRRSKKEPAPQNPDSEAAPKQKAAPAFKKGQQVVVTSGMFKGQSGKVAGVSRGGPLQLELQIFGQVRRLDVDPQSCTPADS